jgi:hypothetical protein
LLPCQHCHRSLVLASQIYAVKNIKSTLRAIFPRGVRLMVFDLNPFKPVTLFYKVRPFTLPNGQLKLFHIYPVNMVNSKK